MNDVLRDFLDTFVMVFLDDIFVYSKSVEEYAQHLRSVLERLRQYKLFAKAPKCCFAVSEIDFLGQKVAPTGMSPTKEKIRAVKEWQRPNDVTDVRSISWLCKFLSMLNLQVYRDFSPLNAAHQERRSRGMGTPSE